MKGKQTTVQINNNTTEFTCKNRIRKIFFNHHIHLLMSLDTQRHKLIECNQTLLKIKGNLYKKFA